MPLALPHMQRVNCDLALGEAYRVFLRPAEAAAFAELEAGRSEN